VATFAPPIMAAKGLSGFAVRPFNSTSSFSSNSPDRAGRYCATPHDRSVGAMARAERIVYVNIRQAGQSLSEAGVVRLFLRMEPEVLEKDDVAFTHPCHRGLDQWDRTQSPSASTGLSRSFDNRVPVGARLSSFTTFPPGLPR
jgi:hypothetical protein